MLKLNEGDEVCRGKYRLIRSLGVGGFAQVFEAENLLTKRRVALKAVDGESAGPEVVARLRREAVVSSRVRHRHIVDVYDLEEEGGGWFLVMEYVRGETLRDALDRGALTPEVALALLCSVMQGLHVMHQHGVVHRDIKPENIYLARQHDSPDLVAKLLDFGICKVAQPDPELPPVTRAGTQAMGTLLYISPEQYADSASVDHRADIYSMGVVLYECLTGRPPHEAASPRELALKMLTTKPAAPNALRPELDAQLSEIAMRALAHDPEQRQGSIAELADALAPFAAASAPQADQVLARRASVAPALPPRRRKGWLTALATVLTAQVSGLYWAAVSSDGLAWAALFSPQHSALAGLLLPPSAQAARGLALAGQSEPRPAAEAAVEVICEIPGVELWVNGEPVGWVLSRGRMQLALSPGLYRFEAVRDGVVVAADTQLVQAGATLSLHLHEPGGAEDSASSMPPKPALVSTVSRSSERRLQNGAVGLDSALSQQQLSDVIKAHQSELQQCYERTVPEAAATSAPLTLELELSVAASGGVTAAHTRGSSLPALATCVEQAAQTWTFPQAVQTNQLRFPLTFRRSAQLTAAQLTAVVARSKNSLQRCYSGANSGSDVLRLDVEMEVLPSGTVSSVQIASDHPDVDACLARLMRLWQFPSAESPTRARFPVLLLPGV